MKRFLLISMCVIAQLNYAQTPIPFKAPKVYNLNSPFQGDFYSFLTLRYDVTTNFYSDFVSQIVEDAYGRIWFVGNDIGFGCIDGKRLYHYGSHNGFFDRQRQIVADAIGGIWIGGNGTGVYHLSQPGVAAHYVKSPLFFPDTVKYDISDVHINSMTVDSKNNVWVGTGLNGISCITPDSTYFFIPPSNEEATRCHNVICDANDVIWFTCRDSLMYIKDDKIFHFQIPDSIKKIQSLFIENHSYILMSDNKNLYKITESSFELFPQPKGIKDNLSNGVKSKDGSIYLKSNQEIYKVSETGELINYFSTEGDFGIADILVDSQNNLWIASHQKGLICLPNTYVRRFPGFKVVFNKDNELVVQNKKSVFELKLSSNLEYKTITHFNFQPEEILTNCMLASNGFYYKTNQRELFYNKSENALVEIKIPQIYFTQIVNTYKDYYSYVENNKALKVFRKNGAEYDFPFYSDRRINLFYVDNEYYYFLEGSHQTGANILRYDLNGELDTLYSNLGGDTLKITGSMYRDDSTFYLSTWGNYILEISESGIKSVEDNLISNILFGHYIDKQGNFWTGGIEGGISRVDAETGISSQYTSVDGFPGSRPTNIGLSALTNDIVVTSRSGLVWFNELNNIPINSQVDFSKKYDDYLFGWEDGLYGQEFGSCQINDQGVIIVEGKGGSLQAIYPNRKEDFGPSNVHFSSIQKENSKREIYTAFRWFPGIVYKPIEQIEIDYTENLLLELSSIYYDDNFNQQYAYRIDTLDWSAPTYSSSFRIAGLSGGEHVLSFVAYSNSGQASEYIQLKVNVHGPIYESKWFWIILTLSAIILFIIIFRWRTYYMRLREKALEKTVKERTAEIEHQKIEIETQHNEIKDSIQYAKRLQDAILPSTEVISKYLPNHFVFFKPKDVVSGDFYWFETRNNRIYIAVADCTGHGVPGALVSVVCSNALNRSLLEFNLKDPNKILDKTRELVIETFSKSSIGVKDGMDIALCAIENDTLYFSGANNPLWIVRNNSLIDESILHFDTKEQGLDYSLLEFKADKQPVGLYHNTKEFTQRTIKLEKGDRIYLISDGFADQFGGENYSLKKPGGKKLKYKPLKKMLLELRDFEMQEQTSSLNALFNNWKGSFEQVDDVCIIGFQVF